MQYTIFVSEKDIKKTNQPTTQPPTQPTHPRLVKSRWSLSLLVTNFFFGGIVKQRIKNVTVLHAGRKQETGYIYIACGACAERLG